MLLVRAAATTSGFRGGRFVALTGDVVFALLAGGEGVQDAGHGGLSLLEVEQGDVHYGIKQVLVGGLLIVLLHVHALLSHEIC